MNTLAKRSVLPLAVAACLATASAVAADYQMTIKIDGMKKKPEATFQSLTFTNCGQTGRTGPSLTKCQAAYSGTDILKPEHGFDVIGGVQKLTVGASGTYRIEAKGASHNQGFGYGASISSEVVINAGDQILILVGQPGEEEWAGSGGTFVAKGSQVSSSEPLLVAGGAGGYTQHVDSRLNASLSEEGNDGNVGHGGSNGHGGQTNTNGTKYGGGGGGGFYSSGVRTTDWGIPGAGFRQGGEGGNKELGIYSSASGGFGGGGAGHYGNEPAGGGGYSGGGGGGASSYSNVTGSDRHGAGGGSFAQGSNVLKSLRTEHGSGSVTITFLGG